MATTRSGQAEWNGDLFSGTGKTTLGTSGLGTYDLTWKARAEDAEGKTSPEELIAAAHAACFSMAFSNELSQAGHTPERIESTAEVDFQLPEGISAIRLTTNATVPGISDEDFQRIAEAAKNGCPVSKALAAVKNITLSATLNS